MFFSYVYYMETRIRSFRNYP